MLYSKEETLEDKLVRLLLSGPATIKGLHERVPASHSEVTLRAVYKAVHALMQKGVVVKAGKSVWIDQEWVSGVRAHLSPALPLLAAGEKLAYTFTSIGHLDAFWKTIALQLEEYGGESVVFYTQHNFWAYVPERKASEDAYYVHFSQAKKYGLFTLGGTTRADMEFKRAYQNDFFQVDTRVVPSLGRRDNINVFGDFVVTTRLSKQLAERVDSLYDSGQPIEKILPGILKAAEEFGEFRLTFEHNAAKAKKLRKLLSPNFYIPTKGML